MIEGKKDPRTLLEEAVRKRDELNTFIKVLQEMLGESEPEASATAPAPSKPGGLPRPGDIVDPLSVVYPGMFFGKSQPQAAKMLLERVGRPLKTKVIVEGMEKGGCKVGGKKPFVNLWGILRRNSDTFIVVPKAGWGLVDWYNQSVLAKMQKESESTKETEENENGDGNEKQ